MDRFLWLRPAVTDGQKLKHWSIGAWMVRNYHYLTHFSCAVAYCTVEVFTDAPAPRGPETRMGRVRIAFYYNHVLCVKCAYTFWSVPFLQTSAARAETQKFTCDVFGWRTISLVQHGLVHTLHWWGVKYTSHVARMRDSLRNECMDGPGCAAKLIWIGNIRVSEMCCACPTIRDHARILLSIKYRFNISMPLNSRLHRL